MKVLSKNNKVLLADGQAVKWQGGGVEQIEWHQCPFAVRNYLTNVTYDPNDYSTSQIADYAPTPAVQSNTKPIGTTVDGIKYYNEVPNIETPFASTNAAGTLKPLDQLRWLNTSTENVRDLGGWTCDGGTVKYGMLVRGGMIAADDKDVLVNQVGIKAELDLRGKDESDGALVSVLGDEIIYCRPDSYNWYSLTNPAGSTETWKEQLRFVFDCISKNIPLYFHCTAGADRTGTLACILEAMLGMNQSDVDKDYELASFATGTGTEADIRARNERNYWVELIRQITALTVGNTFRDKVINWVASLGFSADEINAYRAAMIDGTPETVTPILTTYTITKTTEYATISGEENTVEQYQSYSASITPADGYELDTVSVTMGGQNVKPNYYQEYIYPSNKGNINIPVVTGNIAIAAKAKASAPKYTNLADPTSEDWLIDKRWGSSGTLTDEAGKTCTNYITVSVGDVIRFKGIDFTTARNNSRFAMVEDGTSVMKPSQYTYYWNSTDNIAYVDAGYDETEGVWKFTVKQLIINAKNYNRLRWYFPTPTDVSTIIITKNQIIE